MSPEDLQQITQAIGTAVEPLVARLDKLDAAVEPLVERLDKLDMQVDAILQSQRILIDSERELTTQVQLLVARVGKLSTAVTLGRTSDLARLTAIETRLSTVEALLAAAANDQG